MKLHFRKYGQGEPLIILHGLFGSSDNWHSLARRWGKDFTVYTLDLRNHGSSPHESIMNYPEMVRDLKFFIDQERLAQVHILGHSMGGKVGMLFASLYPDHVDSLIVLDIGIDRVAGKHDPILNVLRMLNPQEFTTRDDIKTELDKMLTSVPLQQFLLKNILRKIDGGLDWKFNHSALLENYPALTMGLSLDESFLGSALFLRGENSNYLTEELSPQILQYFPLAQLISIPEAGHWIHAEQPDRVYVAVNAFLLGS